MHQGQARVRYLDGLRGLAILLVMGWHFFGRIYWMHLPYGMGFTWLPTVGFGWAGVNLFFLISGYVIFLTLERCTGFVDFMLRRWIRLFPAMLVGSVIVFVASQLLAKEMPGHRHGFGDLVPGLTLINPIYFEKYLGLRLRSLDGAFWSLYVEAAFYLVIGSLFFLVGWARALAALIALWIGVELLPSIARMFDLYWLLRPPYRFLRWAGVGYFGWFAAGALFQKAQATKDRGLFVMGAVIGLVAAVTTTMPDHMGRPMRLALAGCVLLFAAALTWRPLQRLLETRVLLFVGFVSYPLYLVHSALGVGLIAWIAARVPLPDIVPPLLVIALMLALAWVIAAWAEPAVARALKPVVQRLRILFRVRSGPRVPDPVPASIQIVA